MSKETPDYVRTLEQMHENIRIAMGDVNSTEDTAILVPWISDLVAAHTMTIRQAYNEGDMMTLAQLIPASYEAMERLQDMISVILVNFLGNTERDPQSLIPMWVNDINHYNTVTTEKIRENLLEMGWGTDHVMLIDPMSN